MTVRRSSPSRRLTRDDWVEAALAAIADGGLAAVAVEPIAARLGATKGSFYWHFANREALLEAALARWEAQTTADVVREVLRAPEDPDSQLRRLVVRVIEIAEDDRVGPALLATAGHPTVAPVLARATRARLAVIAAVFHRMGLRPAEARRRALLAYSAYLGHAQLAHSTPDLLPATKGERRAYLDHVLQALSNSAGSARHSHDGAPREE